jgi:hypothetical protein
MIFQAPTASGREHDCAARSRRRRQVQPFGGRVLIGVLEAKDLLDGDDPVFDIHDGLIVVNVAGDRLHGRGRRAHQVIGPDHGADTGLAEHITGSAVVLRRHDDQRRAAAPLARKNQDFIGPRQLAVNENGIRAGAPIGLRASQGFLHAPTRDQRLDSRDNAEIRVSLSILPGGNLAGKLFDIRQGLTLTIQEAVGLGKDLVFNAHSTDAALLELANQAAQIVEVAIAGITVEQDRQITGVGHELQHVDDLGPARLIIVAYSELGGNRQP